MTTFFEGLSAFATLGALVAAVYAGVQAKKLYAVESARDEQARENDRRRQASQVSAWAAMQIQTGNRLIYGVVVRNSSDDPVYDVQATCHGFTSGRTTILRCVPPGEYFLPNVLKEGRFHWDYAKPVEEVRDPVRPFTASDHKGVDVVTFRDNIGVAWQRAARGELSTAD